VIALCLAVGACALKPIERDDLSAERVEDVRAALGAFREDARLAPFFEGAELIAVYPTSGRAATGFGGAYGRGLVFDADGRVVAHSRMWQLSVGAQLGGQIYRQILFFKSRAAYDAIATSAAEFAGQANAALVTWGIDSTPSFDAEVALFTELRGGLLVEASVGAHGYQFAPVE
jgi:lipid-binding SYLF domain-containing protein